MVTKKLAEVSRRDLRPVLVVVSDGIPTDESGMPSDNWRGPLEALNQTEAGGKADRLALAIGEDADIAMLDDFVEHARKRRGEATGKVFRVDEASKIREFFEYVSFISKRRGTTGSDRVVEDNDIPEMSPSER